MVILACGGREIDVEKPPIGNGRNTTHKNRGIPLGATEKLGIGRRRGFRT